MNVTVETLGPCKKLIRVELDAPEVDKAFEDMTGKFQRQASLPGFRAGKAPRHMVQAKYAGDIERIAGQIETAQGAVAHLEAVVAGRGADAVATVVNERGGVPVNVLPDRAEVGL